MKVTPCPTKTPSSMRTPSQMKVWLDTLTRRPIRAPFWISTKAPIFDSSPISQPYRFTKLKILTSRPSLTSGAIDWNFKFVYVLMSVKPRQLQESGQLADHVGTQWLSLHVRWNTPLSDIR